MGRRFVRFSCQSCGHCCTDVVCLPTPWDVMRIVREVRVHPEEFLVFITSDEITEVEDDDPTWLEVNGTRYLMALKRGKKGCVFLNKKTLKCKIYESRPILCRLYPFCYEETESGEYKRFTLHDDVGCPRVKGNRIPTEPLRALLEDDNAHQEDYQALVRAFNKKDYPGKKPEDFLAMFIEVKGGKKPKKGKKK